MKVTAFFKPALVLFLITAAACSQAGPDTNKAEKSQAAASQAEQSANAVPTLLAQNKVARFVEGKHYFQLARPLPVGTGEKIEVKELFWYGCPHCFRLEPHLIKWVANKPENSEFVAVPAIFSRQWEFHAKAYYTIEALNIADKAHKAIFDEIHVNRKRIGNFKQLSDFLVKNFDQKEKDVKAAFDSFSVDANLRAAAVTSRDSGANGVPAIVIDGKYRASVSSAGGHDQLLELMNFLIEKAQSERSS